MADPPPQQSIGLHKPPPPTRGITGLSHKARGDLLYQSQGRTTSNTDRDSGQDCLVHSENNAQLSGPALPPKDYSRLGACQQLSLNHEVCRDNTDYITQGVNMDDHSRRSGKHSDQVSNTADPLVARWPSQHKQTTAEPRLPCRRTYIHQPPPIHARWTLQINHRTT